MPCGRFVVNKKNHGDLWTCSNFIAGRDYDDDDFSRCNALWQVCSQPKITVTSGLAATSLLAGSMMMMILVDEALWWGFLTPGMDDDAMLKAFTGI